MATPVDTERKLQVLLDSLSEAIASVTDAELLADAKAMEEDVDRISENTRQLLLGCVYQVKRARLEEAEHAHRHSVQRLAKIPFALPALPDARRKELGRILHRHPKMQEAALTLQHRNFEAMTDADVERLLSQLHHLGVLAESEDEEPE